MFSCCRANTKNSKKSKKSNEDSNGQNTEQETTKNDNKNRIIPTITIENGKTAADNNLNNELNANNVKDEELNENVITETNEESLAETEIVTVQPTTIEAAPATVEPTRAKEINGIVLLIMYILISIT